MSVTIREVALTDAVRLCDIYNHHIVNTIVTFETQALSAQEFAARIAKRSPELPWLVVEVEGLVGGYCYAAPWKSRAAYEHSVETSIYLDKDAAGKGLGKRLYTELLSQLMGYHAIISGISLPNEASIALHESLGFLKVAHFSEVGRKFDRWVDVGYWQLRVVTVSKQSVNELPWRDDQNPTQTLLE